ncbi:hypothetical protein DFH08DRAFT_950460 [Mycena albidolilacea]|uniref:Cysteine-rich transmembrane CYSTM domain-containing protein n=1 Tax=Mycena albidolilacea TaxID=1033008 RepID=A0AAD7AQ51_9AGAR|nr:hypothetical protein DFH08DRAFT_950460 [Mycena albidolilacea]
MSAAPTTKATTSQPQATEMNVMNVAAKPAAKDGVACKQGEQCEHEHKASRMRGGGAGKDCLMGMLGCFLCFECCEGCCECIADIVCCPCEMCC